MPTVTSNNGGNGYQQNPFLFAGGIQDRATGWIHYGARWYNPTTGRWTQQDTLDSPLDPLNANRYAYAGNDPINNPTGYSPSTCAGALFFGVFAAAGTVVAGAAIVAAAALTAGLSVVAGLGLVAGTTAAGVDIVGSLGAILTECG